MGESCALVCVAGGQTYLDYAERLMESAREFFRPAPRMEYLTLDGEEGWPGGSMMRYHRLLRETIETDYLYMIDADMLVVSAVADEVLPTREQPDAIVVTCHPGYVGTPPYPPPFENRTESACYVPPQKRGNYFCGGFVGGERGEFLDLARMIVKRLDEDIANGIEPIWSDESALNCAVVHYYGYRRELSPSYCHPQDSSWYETWWSERYEPKIQAIDKTKAERGER